MAVYTHLEPMNVTAWLAENYPQLGSLRALHGISQGVENTNYLLELEAGNGGAQKAILTVFEKRVRPADLPYYLGLMAHLAAKGCAVPEPYLRADGALFGLLAGKQAVVVRFLDGENMAPATPSHLEQLGAAMAQMHLAGADFALNRTNDLSPFVLAPLLTKCGAGLDGIAPNLLSELMAELRYLRQEMPKELPTGQIHADLFRDNVFFLGARYSGLIDFYFACTDSYAYDLAVTAVAWCMDEVSGALDGTLLEALLRGYGSVRALDAQEKRAIPLLMRGAAVRFLLTRAHDWMYQVPGALVVVKDPKEYLAKWRTLLAWDQAAAC
jgi:homoserine kinase type II